MTWYFSICIFKWISSRCFSGILGSLAPLGLLLWPLKCFWLKKPKWPPVVISLTKNFIKLKSTFQQISSWFVKKIWVKSWNWRSYEWKTDFWKIYILSWLKENLYLHLWKEFFEISTFAIWSMNTYDHFYQFYSVWTFLWAAMEENILKNGCFIP